MSEELHPNINAVGLTTDIISSIEKWLRNEGKELGKEVLSNDNIKQYIIDFSANISTEIDNIVEAKT